MVADIARLLLAGVFLWAAISKAIFSPSESTMYGTLVSSHGWMLHYGTILVEGGLGIWLATGWSRHTSALVALLMLSVFCGAILLETTKHHPKPCGCLSVAEQEARSPERIQRDLLWNLTRNGVMAFAASWIFIAAEWRRG